MSSSSTIPSFSDLASMTYSTFILHHVKYNTNLELNRKKIVSLILLSSTYTISRQRIVRSAAFI